MGLIFNKKEDIIISEADYKTQIELIKYQFHRVIQYSQNI